MRIGIDCHFESKIRQGTNTYVSELVSAIARNDKRNTYFLLNAEYPEGHHRQESNNIIKKRIKTNSTRINIIYGYSKISKLNRFDILHTNYLTPFWTSCKKVVTVHDILFKSQKFYFPLGHRLQLSLLTPFTMNLADKIISVSEHTRKEIICRFHVSPSKVCVIHEAASQDFKRINDGDLTIGIKGIKRKYGLNNNYILYVGRYAPIKNIPRMIRIFSEYNKRAKEKISFVLVGNHDPVYPDKELTSILQNRTEENGILVLKDIPKSDLVFLYNGAEALFFITYGEGFGLPIIEAMACGLPVITSNVTSCPEVTEDAAILVNPKDDRAILEALTTILDSEDRKRKYIEKGLKRASLFSWDTCAKKTIKVYQSLGNK